MHSYGVLCGLMPVLSYRTVGKPCTGTYRVKEAFCGKAQTHSTRLWDVTLFFFPTSLPSGKNRKYNTINFNNSYFCNWGRIGLEWKRTHYY